MIGGTCDKLASFFCHIKNRTYHKETGDLEVLDRFEVRLHFELGQHDNLVTTVDTSMASRYQRINMALGQKTKRNIGVKRLSGGSNRLPPFLLVQRELKNVRNDIPVRNHNTFL